MSDGMETRPALSVAICSRDRPDLVIRLVGELARLSRDAGVDSDRISIYVSDNSRDVTAFDRIEAATRDTQSVFTRRASRSFPSAEEHLRDLLNVVPGPYVWSLADDDLPQPGAFSHIFSIIDEKRPDIIVVNPRIVSYSSSETLHQRYAVAPWIPAEPQDTLVEYSLLIQMIGLIHLSCLLSALIFDKRLIRDGAWDKYLSVSPIYAHSFVFLESFSRSPAVLTSRDIFWYRSGASETNNLAVFEKLAASLNVSTIYFWAGALIKNLDLCIEAGAMTSDEVNDIREVHWAIGPFSLLRFIFDRIMEKLAADVTALTVSHPMNDEEIMLVRRLMRRLPAGILGLFEEVVRLYHVVYPFALLRSSCDDVEIDLLDSQFRLLYDGEQNAVREAVRANVVGRIQEVQVEVQRAFMQLEALPPGRLAAELLPAANRAGEDRRQERMLRQVEADVQEEFRARLLDWLSLFDANWYAAHFEGGRDQDPSLEEKVAFEHFEVYGSRSGRSPNSWFDEIWYTNNYSEVGDLVRSGRVVSGFDYYLRSGWKFGHDPSREFAEQAYLDAHPDVAAAVKDSEAGLRSGFEHWLTHGRHEGRRLRP